MVIHAVIDVINLYTRSAVCRLWLAAKKRHGADDTRIAFSPLQYSMRNYFVHSHSSICLFFVNFFFRDFATNTNIYSCFGTPVFEHRNNKYRDSSVRQPQKLHTMKNKNCAVGDDDDDGGISSEYLHKSRPHRT